MGLSLYLAKDIELCMLVDCPDEMGRGGILFSLLALLSALPVQACLIAPQHVVICIVCCFIKEWEKG